MTMWLMSFAPLRLSMEMTSYWWGIHPADRSCSGFWPQPVKVSAGVLVGSLSSGPAFGTFISVLRNHPWQVVRYLAARSLRLPTDMPFERLGVEEAKEISGSLCGESPWVQYQLLFHLSAKIKPTYLLLFLHSTHDWMVPLWSARATARHYNAQIAGEGRDWALHDARLWLGADLECDQ